jgi:hypothetical protein
MAADKRYEKLDCGINEIKASEQVREASIK